ncbi:MAG TPA: hypothetical protein VNO31_28100, partial [Umezawaea sp.]|nr:hypothetical protein [Umezawaea sp.]
HADVKLLRENITEGEFWLTGGDQAPSALELLDICMELAADLGLGTTRPRLIPTEAVDRLILPLLEDSLPPRMALRFRNLLEFSCLFQNTGALPNSMAELGFAENVTKDALRRAVYNSLYFWAQSKGLVPVEQKQLA